MAIEVRARPYTYNWSGNSVHYRLYSASAAADNTIYFEVMIRFANIGDAYADVVTLPCYPTQGFVSVDIKDILDSKLEYQRPAFDVDETLISAAPKQTGLFYIEFREITTGSSDPSWDTSESEYPCGVIKGGLSYFAYRNNNFWSNYWAIDGVYKFMTWQQNRRLANINERMYLAFLNGIDTGTNALQVVAIVYYSDGTNDNVTASFASSTRGLVYYIPAGCVQWGLHLLDPDKKIKHWTIEVRVSGSAISEVFRFTADNRKNYNDYTLHYRNSLGGLDSLRIRGVIQHNLNYEGATQQVTHEPDYYSGDEITPQETMGNNKELKVWKGDIGYLAKEEQDRLRDSQVKRECWWERSKKWWPVVIVTPSFKQKESTDQLWSMPFEWKLAHSGEHYYTPESVDLGDSTFTENVCLALPTTLVVTVDLEAEPDAAVQINFTETDPQNASTTFQYFIETITPSPVVINYSSLPITLNLPKEQVYNLELRSICSNGMLGKKVTQLISTVTGEDPGGGVDDNSYVLNTTSNAGTYLLKINATDIADGSLGSFNQDRFHVEDDYALATVVLTLTGIVPSIARLFADSGEHIGTISSGGGNSTITFTGVNISEGISITLS